MTTGQSPASSAATLRWTGALPIPYAMKLFSCGDVVPGCDAHWERDTEDDILAAVAQHAVDAHGLTSVPATLVAAVRSAIVSR